MANSSFHSPSSALAQSDASPERPPQSDRLHTDRESEVLAVRQLIRDRRYCVLLRLDDREPVDAQTLASAWKALEEDMALVPAMHRASGGEFGEATVLKSLYLDRYAVTNEDYARFVRDGGYERMDYWPEEIWPRVLQFVDSTGYAGPRFWVHGEPPKQLLRHPVVGISWYEAYAYAAWCGKRLPLGAEWERAGSWPAGLDGRETSVRYPWGNSFDHARANIWSSAIGTTVPVDEYEAGCTPNGIYQLVGNVWEWMADRYIGPSFREGLQVFFDQVMGEVRGGAFDTYFENQVTCSFQTGQARLFRGPNVGFRCAMSIDQLRQPPDPAAFYDEG